MRRALTRWIECVLIRRCSAVLTLNSPAGQHYNQQQCQIWVVYQLTFMEALTVAAEVILTMRRECLTTHTN